MSDANTRLLARRLIMLPAIMLLLATGGAIRHWIQNPDRPCEKLFSEGELRELTARRVRTAEVEARAGFCAADYGAARVVFSRGAVDEERRSLSARPGFVEEREIAGLGFVVEARQIDLDSTIVTRTLLAARAGGWIGVALKTDRGTPADAALEARAIQLLRERLSRADEFFQ